MFLFSLVFLAVALVLIGAGFAAGLVACALGGLLLSLGVLSSSVFVGVRSGRLTLAMRAFLLQCGLLAGLPAGAVVAWLARPLFAAVDPSAWSILGEGALGGALGGVIVALLLDFCLRRLHRWAVTPNQTPRGAVPGNELFAELHVHSAGSHR